MYNEKIAQYYDKHKFYSNKKNVTQEFLSMRV